MSMSQDTENFGSLGRLLALKRHEQPPPGYFHRFSSQVITRIESGESGEKVSVLERLLWEAPWLERLWASLEAKPVLAGAFGVAVCGLLITGVMSSDTTDATPVALIPATAPVPGRVEFATVSAADHPLLAKPAMFEASSTDPVGMAEDPFLSALGKLQPRRAALILPGRN